MSRFCKSCRKFTYTLDYDSGKPSEEMEIKNMVRKGFSMMQSFATSMMSRGLANKKTNKPTKRLRVLSCFGDESIGGDIKACDGLMLSKVEDGKFYCGKCGCGDKPMTWLMSEGGSYSKLDYPKLLCPLKMPGFTNYMPASNETTDIDQRKLTIENYNVEKLTQITVSLPPKPE